MRNKFVNFLQQQVVLIDVVQEQTAIIISVVRISPPLQLLVSVGKVFVLDVWVMITRHVPVNKECNGSTLWWSNKPMPSGLHKILNFAHGATKLSRDLLGVISWLVYVENPFATCAVNPGNLITRITSSVPSIKRSLTKISVKKKQFLRKWTFMQKNICILLEWSRS